MIPVSLLEIVLFHFCYLNCSAIASRIRTRDICQLLRLSDMRMPVCLHVLGEEVAAGYQKYLLGWLTDCTCFFCFMPVRLCVCVLHRHRTAGVSVAVDEGR